MKARKSVLQVSVYWWNSSIHSVQRNCSVHNVKGLNWLCFIRTNQLSLMKNLWGV